MVRARTRPKPREFDVEENRAFCGLKFWHARLVKRKIVKDASAGVETSYPYLAPQL